jgi:hypothetical protein
VRGLGPRFAVEAGFLVVVAVGAWLARLGWVGIVGVMAGAWLLVAAIEWVVSRDSARRLAQAARRSDATENGGGAVLAARDDAWTVTRPEASAATVPAMPPSSEAEPPSEEPVAGPPDA